MTVIVSVQHIGLDSPKSSGGLRRIMGMRDRSDVVAGVNFTHCWVCGCRRNGRTCHLCYGS
jgi:hypothetical protein